MITISAGHFGPGTGANGFLDEGKENILVAKRVVEILKASGISTNYIQDTVNKSKNANVNWLVEQHNKTSRNIDVQIHFNASSGSHSKGIGTEVLVKGNSLVPNASDLSKAIAESAGFKNRGAKVRYDLGFLNRTAKPAYLIEVCFVNDSVDAALYRRDFEKVCQAIAKGLAKIVGKQLNGGGNVIQKIEYNTKNGTKVWRIQSGKYTSKEAAVEAAKKTGLPYVTIVGGEV